MGTIDIVRICGQVATAHWDAAAISFFHSSTFCIVLEPSQILFRPSTMDDSDDIATREALHFSLYALEFPTLLYGIHDILKERDPRKLTTLAFRFSGFGRVLITGASA
jgi:hypothetical protein